METHTPQPTPTLPLQDLQHIQQEVTAARHELLEMIEIAGFRAIWNEPRKYFVPKTGSRIPFPNGQLNRLVKPVWRITDLEDPARRAVREDILLNVHGSTWCAGRSFPSDSGIRGAIQLARLTRHSVPLLWPPRRTRTPSG